MADHPYLQPRVVIPTAIGVGLIVLGLWAARLEAADWPQWRGPQRNGFSDEKGLTDKVPTVKWESPLPAASGAGHGYHGSPVVCGGRVFCMGAWEPGKALRTEALIAFDTATGKEAWKLPLGAPRGTNLARVADVTPCAEGDLVWTVCCNGEIVCANAATGKEVWRAWPSKSAGPDGSSEQKDGVSSSPQIYGDYLIAFDWKCVAALDKKTGQVQWTWPKDGVSLNENSSPTVGKLDGKDLVLVHGYTAKAFRNQYVERKEGDPPTPVESEALFGIELASGKLLFTEQAAGEYNSPMLCNGLVFTTRVTVNSKTGSMYGTVFTLVALKPVVDGSGMWTTSEIWRAKGLSSSRRTTFSPATDNERVFCFNQGSKETLKAFLPQTGDVTWTNSSVYAHHDSCSLSPIVADGKMFVNDADTDRLVCITATEGKELWTLPLTKQPEGADPKKKPERGSYATPALAGGALFVRGRETLRCFGLQP